MPPGAGQLFFEDTSGFEAPVETGIPSPKFSRSLSPASSSSSSSEEAIVFSGRSRPPFPASRPTVNHETDRVARASAKPIHVLEDSIDLIPAVSKSSLGQRSRKHNMLSAQNIERSPRRKSAPRKQEDPSMEDYISNIKLNGLLADDPDIASVPAGISPANTQHMRPQTRIASTEQSRTTPIGNQPHFKASTVDNDDSDGSKNITHLADQADGASVECKATGSGRTRVADGQLARLLSKQEELGLGSNDLILYDGLQEGAPSDPDLSSDGDDSQNAASRTRGPRPKDSHRSRIASPLPFHESYGDFDVMDFERPSLRRKSKAQRAKADFDVSDSDVQHALQVAWKNDRSKKKAKKQERQELRLKGLLGKGNEKTPNLKSKYPDGISLHQIGVETEVFLSSSNDNLCLPPMDAHARKIVHEIGHRHGLKSRSMGAGNARFPILYKTSRTRDYDVRVLAQVGRRFMPNPTKGRKKTRSGMQAWGGAGPGAAYRDGEIVGASAPELGQDNKGRAILEKMGWSTGTGLGASNSGLSAPVQQIVKTTRAGLG